jgi:hypothetical protein
MVGTAADRLVESLLDWGVQSWGSSSSDRGLVDPQSPPLAQAHHDRMASRSSQRNCVVVA